MDCLDYLLKYGPSSAAVVAAITVYYTRKYFLLKERIVDLSKIAAAQSDVVEIFQGYHYSIGMQNKDTTVSIEPIIVKQVHLRGVIRQSFTIDELARDRLLEAPETKTQNLNEEKEGKLIPFSPNRVGSSTVGNGAQ